MKMLAHDREIHITMLKCEMTVSSRDNVWHGMPFGIRMPRLMNMTVNS